MNSHTNLYRVGGLAESTSTIKQPSQRSSNGVLYQTRGLESTLRKGILNVNDETSREIRIVAKTEQKSFNYQRRIMQSGRFRDPRTGLSIDP